MFGIPTGTGDLRTWSRTSAAISVGRQIGYTSKAIHHGQALLVRRIRVSLSGLVTE